jgi:hypothetical protein
VSYSPPTPYISYNSRCCDSTSIFLRNAFPSSLPTEQPISQTATKEANSNKQTSWIYVSVLSGSTPQPIRRYDPLNIATAYNSETYTTPQNCCLLKHNIYYLLTVSRQLFFLRYIVTFAAQEFSCLNQFYFYCGIFTVCLSPFHIYSPYNFATAY